MKLPQISGKELIKKLRKFDFVVTRQKVSHVRPKKNIGEKIIKITLPNHKSLKKRTLNQIIKSAGLTREEVFS